MTATFSLRTRGPYSFDASARFLRGFGPASHNSTLRDGHVHIAFVPEGEEAAVGVCLQTDGDEVRGEVFGDQDADLVAGEVRRILSLDVDGTDYSGVGRRDPIIGELQARYPGLRPVLFFTPYEAAVWALLSQRVRMSQAASAKATIARQYGDAVTIHGDTLRAFPGPACIMELPGFPGMFGRKLEYLHELGHAAHAGRLDAAGLRAMPVDEALETLRSLPGVGEFSARLILLRGAGEPDGPPAREPRFLHAFSVAYGIEGEPDNDTITAISEEWRPYRTWITVLLRVMLDDKLPGR